MWKTRKRWLSLRQIPIVLRQRSSCGPMPIFWRHLSRVIYTPEELQTAIDDYWDCDYIFIDTAGRSHQNAEQLEKMKEMVGGLKRPEDYQVFLVLSATTKYRDLQKIADCYGKIAKFELIFTKLDETEAVGNLLNIKLYTDAPIAYVTCGQNVPDDMEMFNPQKTVKQILGGKE